MRQCELSSFRNWIYKTLQHSFSLNSWNYFEAFFVCSQSKFEIISIVNWYSTNLAENDWNLPIKNHEQYVWHFNFGSVDNFGEVLFIFISLYNVYHSHKTDNFFWNVQNLVELCVILHVFCVFHLSFTRNFERKRNWKHYNSSEWNILFGTCKSLSEALLFAEHEENMLCTKIVLNVRNNFLHNMFSSGLSLEFSCHELVIQWTICHYIVG